MYIKIYIFFFFFYWLIAYFFLNIYLFFDKNSVNQGHVVWEI